MNNEHAPDLITQAGQTLLAAKAERRELQTDLHHLDRLITTLEVYLGENHWQPQKRRPGRPGRVKPEIVRLLSVNGGIMHASEIVAALQRGGIRLSLKDPRAVVVTALLRMVKDGDVAAFGKNRYRWIGNNGANIPAEKPAL